MATSDKEQQSVLVPQHKRMAQGAPISGQTLENKSQKNTGGALSQAKKSK